MSELKEYIDPFILPDSVYKRGLSPFAQYVDDSAFFLSTMYDVDKSECVDFIKNNLKPDGLFPFKDPRVKMTQKDDNGDSEVVISTLSNYVSNAISNNEIIAPTLTTYLPEQEKQSYLVDFTLNNIKNRSKAKKEMFKYEMLGDRLNYIIKKNDQNNQKISNNSISGASCVSSTPIYNPTMHSSLTSTCRVTSAYANSNNEKLLGGNRHYRNINITLNDIVSICNHTDYNLLQKVMNKYNLHYPTPDETMDVVLKSSRQYYVNKPREGEIKKFIEKLSPIQRAAFVYTSDLYHLRIFNNDVIYTLINKLSKKHPINTSIQNQVDIINNSPETIYHLASQICRNDTIGIDINLKETKESELGLLLASNILEIYKVIEEYTDFFITFFRSTNMPLAISDFRDSIRHVVLMSDTDSTIFTVEEWIEWYFKDIPFSEEANGVFATMVFLSVSSLKHILAMMSANIGVNPERIHLIAMKNEYKFEVFVPTLNTKHYYALITYQEGNIYKKPKMEIKGVHLKSSNSPRFINKLAEEMMEEICVKVINREPISVKEYMKKIADVEKTITNHVQEGLGDFYRIQTIKEASAYQNDELESLYKHHLFWNDTFGKIYGTMPEPPYQTYKINTDIKNKTDMKNYLLSLENKELAKDIENFFNKQKASFITTLYVPCDLFSNRALPKEITDRVDIRKMLVDICHTLYYILETLGIFRINKYFTRLLSDDE